MPSTDLTQRRVDVLKPRRTTYDIHNSELKGFGVRILPSGRKRYFLNIANADLRAYFDTIPRDWLITFLEHRIGDRRVIRLIQKGLNAGVMVGR